ncbi:MAG: glycosyltransferase family 4 protein [Lachnospiraceae bacterium]|nr:glycosyltransferase family 4 protein [Lachnospiraceae bacterium]
MNVMHLLATAGTGGIESLCKDYAIYSENNNIFVVLWGKNDVTACAIRQNGHTVLELNSKKTEIFKVICNLNRIVKKYSIDTVVVHHAAPILHIYMYLLKMRFRRIRTVAYAHGEAKDMCRHNELKGLELRRNILRYSLKQSDKVIAISQAVKKSLEEYLSVPSDKITVIYNGTDTSRFKPDIHTTIKIPVKLVYVGRLIKEKGVQTTIKVLSDLPENLDWTFDIIGDGNYRKKLEQLSERMGLKEQVHFYGTCSDIPEILNNHDIFIHMPLWEEGFGITTIEAMAAGLLCICMDKGGIPEIISNGKDGILVHSEVELSEVLVAVLAGIDRYQIAKLRENAVNKAKDFDIKRFSKQLDSVIYCLKSGEK